MAKTKLRLKRVEKEAIKRMVKAGLFSNRDEAVRVAVIKYATDMGLLTREDLWKDIEKYEKRKVTPEQLVKDLEDLESET